MSAEGPRSAGRVAALVAARTARWTPSERAALAAIVAELRPSARHLTDILDWLDDIAVRDGCGAGSVLAEPSLAAALRSRGSAPDRLKRWKARLRRLRYPRLAAREAGIADEIRALDLGPGLRIASPVDLEGGELTVTIRARSVAELRAALDRLQERVASGAVERIFVLLEEA